MDTACIYVGIYIVPFLWSALHQNNVIRRLRLFKCFFLLFRHKLYYIQSKMSFHNARILPWVYIVVHMHILAISCFQIHINMDIDMQMHIFSSCNNKARFLWTLYQTVLSH